MSATQEFYRYYVFPDATHCGGAGMTNPVLFEALVNWVEHGIAPDHVVAQVNPTRTRKVCMYPDVARYSGSGSTDDEASFTCEHRDQDDPALLAQDRGMLEGLPPLKGNDDIRNVPGGGRDDADE